MIVDNEKDWTARFESGWLKNFIDNKSINWKLYKYVKNEQAVPGNGIELSKARILLISSAGAFLPAKDKPFFAANLMGDYSIRTFPTNTSPSSLEYAHDHYDQTAVREDAQVLLPLAHLQDLVNQKIIGGLSEQVVSFMGYQPFVGRVLKKTFPAILKIAREEQVDAVLLVPS
ncbi:MAG: hypothetical protein ISR87_10595 [Candidatus Marinimicrobia bacterium]|nr:hypothetical protein [FCB group bacterium]MBL7025894.1 hypothetical protein [Candidatus Neomarinimicrobiota bacterium]